MNNHKSLSSPFLVRCDEIAAYILILMTLLTSCSKDITAPSLPSPQGDVMPQGTELSADKLFGIWQGTTSSGLTNANHFEQTYKVEFQDINDAEAVLSHWFVDAETTICDSVSNLEYTYTLNGSTILLTPKPSAAQNGAVAIQGIYTGDDNMVLFTSQTQQGAAEDAITRICTITRTGDPQPTITAVDRTLPMQGETVTLTGRNLQFVDHLYLPTEHGEIQVKDFKASSKQIQFTMPQADVTAGYVRCQATGAHVSAYTPAMFCTECVFLHNFDTKGKKNPYTGTEFENTINITQSLFDKVTVVSSNDLPDGHCLTLPSTPVISPDTMLCFFGNTPVAWAVDNGLDPGTGMLRFSLGDRIQYVIDHSNGLITENTKCKDAAIEMDIYVATNGTPAWNTGFMSFRLDKDQSKSLTQSWFAQTAMWDMDSPMSFKEGWKTYTIPLSAFKVTESTTYATVGNLKNYLRQNKKQTVIKLVNYQLDATHPAQAVSSFQFCLANMRLVPYGIPANKEEETNQ